MEFHIRIIVGTNWEKISVAILKNKKTKKKKQSIVVIFYPR